MKLRPEPPSSHALSRAYGVEVPASLVRLAGALHSWAAGDAARLERAWSALGFLPAGGLERCLCSGRESGEERYPQTPPEFLVIGAMGVDGVHFGLIAHAPERPSDWALGYLCPMDDDGVVTVGNTLAEGLGALLSEAEAREDADAEAIAHFRATLGIERGPPARPAPVRPPEGWAYVASADGVGTLARRGAFREIPPSPAPDPLGAALDDLGDGFAGSALVRLREAWWNDWGEEGARLCEPMALAYEALGRPVLAQRARERGSRIASL